MYENTPKIILNEEYLDLRKYADTKVSPKRSLAGTNNTSRRKNSTTNRKSSLKSDGLRFEKDDVRYRLINCGLKKLVNSYHATAGSYQRQSSPTKRKTLRENSMFDPRFRRFVAPDEEKVCLKSQSELSILPKKLNVEPNSPSTPVFQSKKTSNIQMEGANSKVEPTRNKCTMTKNGDAGKSVTVGPRSRTERSHHRSKSRDFCPYKDAQSRVGTILEPEHPTKPTDRYVDSRLREKYSVLKMPWRRTWTIPVFSPKSTSIYNKSGGDNFDRQTYLYDDGTEIDSTYIEGQRKQFSKAFENQCVTLFLIGGSMCGILLVSLLIWLVFGHNLLHYFFTPRGHDHGLKGYVKYVAGGIINFMTTFFHALGTLLTIPTNHVYQAPHDNFRWLYQRGD